MHALPPLALLYIGCFIISAWILQARSPIDPWNAGAPIESFTAALLWMLSLISLLLASRSFLRSKASMIFWTSGSAALAALALDEVWEFHERSSQLVGDDDPAKIISWIASACVLFWIGSRETGSPAARRALLTGFVLQTFWMFVELGDGDLFRLPLMSLPALRTAEELFELLFLASFLLAFLLILDDKVEARG